MPTHSREAAKAQKHVKGGKVKMDPLIAKLIEEDVPDDGTILPRLTLTQTQFVLYMQKVYAKTPHRRVDIVLSPDLDGKCDITRIIIAAAKDRDWATVASFKWVDNGEGDREKQFRFICDVSACAEIPEDMRGLLRERVPRHCFDEDDDFWKLLRDVEVQKFAKTRSLVKVMVTAPPGNDLYKLLSDRTDMTFVAPESWSNRVREDLEWADSEWERRKSYSQVRVEALELCLISKGLIGWRKQLTTRR